MPDLFAFIARSNSSLWLAISSLKRNDDATEMTKDEKFTFPREESAFDFSANSREDKNKRREKKKREKNSRKNYFFPRVIFSSRVKIHIRKLSLAKNNFPSYFLLTTFKLLYRCWNLKISRIIFTTFENNPSPTKSKWIFQSRWIEASIESGKN